MRLGCDLFRNGGSVIVHLLSLCLYRPVSVQVKSIRAKVEVPDLSSSNSFIGKRIIVFIKMTELLRELGLALSTLQQDHKENMHPLVY